MRASLSGLADRLGRLAPIPERDHRAICGLWREVTDLSARCPLPDSGEVGFVISGWACHQRSLNNGRHQIVGFLTPGDPLRARRGPDAETTRPMCLTHVQFIDVTPLIEGSEAVEHPALALALAAAERRANDFLINHIVRLASRDARSGLAHLILELEARIASADRPEDGWFALPIGQRPLSHAMGLSTVHVNKTLAKLRDESLLEFQAGRVRVLDRERLQTLADG